MALSPDVDASIETLENLIAFPSVSSESNQAVSGWVGDQLATIGFQVELTSYTDDAGVKKFNVVGRRDPPAGIAAPGAGGIAYFCHTDVVPTGDWSGPGGDPFRAVLSNDRLYGRGSCDMKGSLAAMLTAARSVDASSQRAPLWIVCTADEEVGFQGARELVEHSAAYREIVAAQPISIIGEPTGMDVVHAHKGIVGFEIVSRGRAAHSSTTDGINANVAMVPMLQTLLELGQRSETEDRYRNQKFDPPTLSWNFGIYTGGTAVNITPERSVAWASLRPMPGVDGDDLVTEAAAKAASLGLEFKTYPGGDPLWIEPDAEFIKRLCELTGRPARTVCFGTDGGEFSELAQRVVWGPGGIAQAHTADEWIELAQLASGVELYGAAIRKWCCET